MASSARQQPQETRPPWGTSRKRFLPRCGNSAPARSPMTWPCWSRRPRRIRALASARPGKLLFPQVGHLGESQCRQPAKHFSETRSSGAGGL